MAQWYLVFQASKEMKAENFCALEVWNFGKCCIASQILDPEPCHDEIQLQYRETKVRHQLFQNCICILILPDICPSNSMFKEKWNEEPPIIKHLPPTPTANFPLGSSSPWKQSLISAYIYDSSILLAIAIPGSSVFKWSDCLPPHLGPNQFNTEY